MEAERQIDYEYALRGKDWDVYWLLLKIGKPMSIREVQKTLKFSSPSIAHHHLEQLRQLGLVEKQEVGGNYVLTSEVKIGVLRHCVKLGSLLFPRYFFYAVFASSAYAVYLLLFLRVFTPEALFIIFFGAVATIVFWVEAFRVWSRKPF